METRLAMSFSKLQVVLTQSLSRWSPTVELMKLWMRCPTVETNLATETTRWRVAPRCRRLPFMGTVAHYNSSQSSSLLKKLLALDSIGISAKAPTPALRLLQTWWKTAKEDSFRSVDPDKQRLTPPHLPPRPPTHTAATPKKVLQTLRPSQPRTTKWTLIWTMSTSPPASMAGLAINRRPGLSNRPAPRKMNHRREQCTQRLQTQDLLAETTKHR